MSETRRRALGLAALTIVAALPPALDADALGDARLFFTPAERERRVDERDASVSAGSGPSRRDGVGTDPTARHPSDASASAKRRPSRGGEFEALLRTGERVRVVVGGEHCRGVRDVPDLHCERLPDDVRAFALDGRRLVVTFLDGRRRRLVVGESLRP